MTARYKRGGMIRRRVHHVRACSFQPMTSTILRAVAALAITAGLSGAFWFSLTTTLDQMTANDCRAGITLACEALKR